MSRPNKQGAKRHGSRSDAQLGVEQLVLPQLSQRLEADLAPGRVQTGDSFVAHDGLYLDPESKRAFIVEVYSHIGRVKAAQRHKVQADILKLHLSQSVLRGKGYEEVIAVIAFVCKECAQSVMGRTWVGDAARRLGIEAVLVDLPDSIQTSVLEAQRRQDLRGEEG